MDNMSALAEPEQMDAQILFHRAIVEADICKLNYALSNGGEFNRGGKSTLHCAIKAMLNSDVSKFNMNFIKELTKYCRVRRVNSLLHIMSYSKQYILRKTNNKKEAESNIIELVQYVIREAKYPEISKNTLIKVIFTDNLRIIRETMICLADRWHISKIVGFSAMYHAIGTENIEIVRTVAQYSCVSKHDVLNFDNLLEKSVEIGNPRIVHEMIVKGARARPHGWKNHYYLDVVYIRSLFEIYYKYIHDNNRNDIDQNDTIDHMLRLIMCSGATVPKKLYDKISGKTHKKFIGVMIMDCYELLEDQNPIKIREPRIEKLRQSLVDMMDCLMRNSKYMEKMISEMEEIMIFVPSECIRIIYEYQNYESKAHHIDWMKY